MQTQGIDAKNALLGSTREGVKNALAVSGNQQCAERWQKKTDGSPDYGFQSQCRCVVCRHIRTKEEEHVRIDATLQALGAYGCGTEQMIRQGVGDREQMITNQ